MKNTCLNFTPVFKRLAISFLVLVLFLGFAKITFAAAGIPRIINFQGKLVNNPLATNVSDTSYTVVFTLYDKASGGTTLWTETQTVTTTDGIFRVALGSVNPIPSNFNFNWDGLYLGVKVNSDSEMTPRVPMTSVPFAFNAQQVAGLTVQDTSGNASTSGILQIANGKTFNFGTNNLTFTTSGDTSLTLPTSGTVCTTVNCLTSDPFWNHNLGALFQNNSTEDFLLGSQATSSAFFSFTGLSNLNHQTQASISGNLIVMSNNGYGGNVGIGTTTPGNKFEIKDTVQSDLIGSVGGMRISQDVLLTNNRLGINFKTYSNQTYGDVEIGAVKESTTGNEKSGLYFATKQGTLGTDRPLERMRISNTGNVGIGTTSPLATLDVRGTSGTVSVASVSGNTSFASLVANNDGIGDLFTASSSGTPKFTVDRNGNLGIGGKAPKTNSSITGPGGFAVLSGAQIYASEIDNTNTSNNAYIGLTDNGTQIKRNIADSQPALYVKQTNSSSTGDILQLANDSTTLFAFKRTGGIALGGSEGSNGNCLLSGGSGSATTWGSCVTGTTIASPFTVASGAIVPLNSTEDFLIGSQATTSALFSFTGVSNLSNQTQASISGQLIVMPNNGYSGRLGIGLTAPLYPLDVVGDINTSTEYRLAQSIVLAVSGSNTQIGNAATNQAVFFRSGGSSEVARFHTNSAFGLGITAPISELHVTRALSVGATGKALAIFDQIENQDILTASKSGVTKFTVSSGGITTTSSQFAAGVTNKLYLTGDWAGSGELPAGVFIRGTGTTGTTIYAGDGSATGQVVLGYSSGGTDFSALEIANVSSGRGNLLLLKSGGSVGIGTTTPNYLLDLYKPSGNTVLNIHADDTQQQLIRGQESAGVSGVFGFNGADNSWGVNLGGEALGSSNNLTIASGGNVGIGTTGPTANLEIGSGGTTETANGIIINPAGNVTAELKLMSTGGAGAVIYLGSANVSKSALGYGYAYNSAFEIANGSSFSAKDELFTVTPAGMGSFGLVGNVLPGVNTPTGTPTTGGSIPNGTYYYLVTSVDYNGAETTLARSVESASKVFSGGGNGKITLSWTAIPGAASYSVYRTTTSGTYSSPSYLGSTTTNSYTDTAAAASSGAPSQYNFAGFANALNPSGQSWLGAGGLFVNGNVGIGTTNPTEAVTIASGSSLLANAGNIISPAGSFGTGKNELTYSQDFSQSDWSKTTGTTVAQNTGDYNAPDGTATAAKMHYDGSGTSESYRLYAGNNTSTNGVPYTVSVWVRASSNTTFRLSSNINTSSNLTATTAWQRFSLTSTGNGASAKQLLIFSGSSDNSPITLYVWGAQINNGSTSAGPYIKTSGTAATTTLAGVFGNFYTSSGDSASAPGISWSADSDTGLFNVAANTIGFSTGGTQRLSIDGSGNMLATGTLTGLTGLTLSSGGINLGGTISDSSHCITGGATAAWGVCGSGGGSNWTLGAGFLTPNNSTVDLLIGGQSTSSAKFAFINVNGPGEPTASIAGQLTLRNSTGNINRLNGGDLSFQTSVGGDSGLSTKLIIKNDGSVGIGTTSPNSLLQLAKAGDPKLQIQNTTGSNGDIATIDFLTTSGTGVGGRIESQRIDVNNNKLNFYSRTAGTITKYMTLDQNGNFGIGNSSPSYPLDVINTAATQLRLGYDTSNYFTAGVSSAGAVIFTAAGASAGFNFANALSLGTNSSANGSLTFYSSGGATAPSVSADSSKNLNLSAPSGQVVLNGTGDIVLDPSTSNLVANLSSTGDFLIQKAAVTFATFSHGGQFNLSGAVTGKALTIFNETGDQNILTASASGTPKFTVDRNGNLGLAGFLPSSSYIISGPSFIVDTSGSVYAAFLKNLNTGNNSVINLTDNGTQITRNIADGQPALYVKQTHASSTGDILQLANNSSTLFAFKRTGGIALGGSEGSNGNCLLSGGSGSATTWGSCVTGTTIASPFTVGSGAIFSLNSTQDFLLGSQATTSAKFAVLNINTGTPVASLSAGVAGGSFLTANGYLSATARQNITIGNSSTYNTTGNILLNPNGTGFIGIGNSSPSYPLDLISTGASATQLRIGYDTSNYFTTGVSSTGAVTFTATGTTPTFNFIGSGNIVFEPSGSDNIIASLAHSSAYGDFLIQNNGVTFATFSHGGQFSLSGAVTGNALAIFNETGDQDILTASVSGAVKFRIGHTGAVFVSLPGTQTGFAVCHTTNGQSTADELVDCTGTLSDYAERYPVGDDVTYGDIVSMSDQYKYDKSGVKVPVMQKSSISYEDAIGVASNNYSDFSSIGDNYDGSIKVIPIALVGRVPVKVTLENGSIKKGDYLAVSSTPGSAMKATRAGYVIGRAMTDWNGAGDGNTVLTYVKTTWYDPGIVINADGNLSIPQNQIQNPIGASQPSVTSSTNSSSSDLSVENATVSGTLHAGTIIADKIEGLEILDNRVINLETLVSSLSALFINNFSDSAVLAETDSTIVSPSAVNQLNLSSLDSGGLATVSGDLRVKGNGLFEGILSVVDTLTTNDFLVNGVSNFFGDAIFKGDVSFDGRPTFNNDTAGTVKIQKGGDRVQITFAKEYERAPIVNASISFGQQTNPDGTVIDSKALENEVFSQNYSYIIVNESTKGFTIVINKKAADDINFSWVALATKGGN